MEKLQKNIKMLRGNKGITQKTFGQLMDVTPQTISKWENGISLPDVTMLEKLSSILEVSVDQLLGISPIDSNLYHPRNKTKATYRDKNMSQFVATRMLLWNDDYLEFMIQKKWAINKAVKIAEIGSGNGIFSKQLLTFLPRGSSYTGFESSPVMRNHGNELYKDNQQVNIYDFQEIDTYHDTFDLVICQGYLRNHKEPTLILSKMYKLLKKGGLIICHEENKPFENFGLLLEGQSNYAHEKNQLQQVMWSKENEHEGRDHSIGLKLPFIF